VFSGKSVTVAIKSNPGGGSLSGTLTAVTVNGVATFGDLRIDKAGTGYTLSVGAAGLFGATSTSFYVAGTPRQLAFGVQPTNTSANQPITPAVQVAVQDSAGNRVPDFVGNVTIAIGPGTIGGNLSGTTTVVASRGVATFPDLSLNVGGSGFILLASATGLSAATSTAFTVACGTNCWSVNTAMPTPRTDLGVGAVNGVLYAVGGYHGADAVGTVEAYDPGTNSWTAKTPMPTARLGFGVGVVNGILYAVGGFAPFVGPMQTVWS
jgi:hypothetical protein